MTSEVRNGVVSGAPHLTDLLREKLGSCLLRAGTSREVVHLAECVFHVQSMGDCVDDVHVTRRRKYNTTCTYARC